MSIPTPHTMIDDDDERPQKAAIALDFLIVGAGLGGLVAAITLKDAGHNVIVLDSRTRDQLLSESNGESFYIGPNIHRLLTHCGVDLPTHETWQAVLTSMRRCKSLWLPLSPDIVHIDAEWTRFDRCEWRVAFDSSYADRAA